MKPVPCCIYRIGESLNIGGVLILLSEILYISCGSFSYKLFDRRVTMKLAFATHAG